MVRFIKIGFIFTAMICFYFLPHPALAKGKVSTNVKVIHASTNSNKIDPGLKEIISELKSVFKYTSYRMIKDQQLNQGFNQKDHVKLPEKRTLTITPLKMENKRIRYQINILKNNRSVFQTQVLLKNNSSITIGGPQYKKGVLLFNISGSAQ